MNKKTKVLFSILVVFSFIFTIGMVSAYRGDVTQTGPNYDSEVHEYIQSAIENNDYESWKEIMSTRSNARIQEYITADNFSEFSKAYQEAKLGDSEALTNFRESLGLGQGNQYRKNNSNMQNRNPQMNNKQKGFQNQSLRNSNCVYN